MNNTHLNEYLKFYLEFEGDIDHAVMINGPWGSGKTWFINNFMKPYKESGLSVYHVSLYGMNSVDDIASELFRQAHPFLSSKAAIVGKACAKAVARGFFKFDFDGDGNADATGDLKDLDGLFPKEDLDAGKAILIFDDVERCSIEIIELLGYINHFVEIQNYKAILIAHEGALKERWLADSDVSTSHRYEEVKEKLIGKEFGIEPEVESAISSFIEIIGCEKTQEIVSKDDVVKTIYFDSKYENLRLIKRGLWDFAWLVEQLPSDILENEDLIRHLFQLVLIYTIESKKGLVVQGSLKPELAFAGYFGDNDPTPLEAALGKYSEVEARDSLLTSDVWDSLLFSSKPFSHEALLDSIKQTSYFHTETSPAWKQIWDYHHLDDDEFDKLHSQIREQFFECDFKYPEEMLHVFGLLLSFISMGLFDYDVPDLKNKALLNVDEMLETGVLYNQETIEKEWGTILDTNSWEGLGYASYQTMEFAEVKGYINKKRFEGLEKYIADQACELLSQMRKDACGFLESLVHRNEDCGHYYNKPILKHLDPKEFVNTFAALGNPDKRLIISALSLRYDNFHARMLIDELEWLQKVEELMSDEAKNWRGRLSYLAFEEIERSVGKGIQVLQVIIEEISVDD